MADTGKILREYAGKRLPLAVATAVAICLLVYLRAIFCDFTNLDDPAYVINNSSIRQLDQNLLVSAFTRPYYFGWLPLTSLSFAVDYHFWQLNPMGYHLTNVLLHSCNVGLVVLITDSLCRQKFPLPAMNPAHPWLYPSMLVFTGLLFGLHPMRVEAVAWVSQRKDVLNGLFSLGAVFVYLHYARKKMAGRAAAGAYCLSLVLFLFSLMAKQVSVVLPVMLLVCDWYPLGRLRRDNLSRLLAEKIPYLALSVAVTLLAIRIASGTNVMITAEDFPFYARCLVSGNALFEYCRYLLYPVGILPSFVIGDTIQPSFVVKTVIVVVFTGLCLAAARKRPEPAALWLNFILPLLPVLAFTQAADDTSFASRHTYLPSVAPAIAAGILSARGYLAAAGSKPRLVRTVFPVLATALVIGYGAMTLRLIAAWQDPGTLWTRQIEIEPLGRAYTFRGIYYFSRGRHDEALQDFAQAIRIAREAGREDVFNLLAYHGETLRALGRHEEAVADFTAAISLSRHPQYYFFRGSSLQALGRSGEAAEDFRRAGTNTGPISWFPGTHEQLMKKQ